MYLNAKTCVLSLWLVMPQRKVIMWRQNWIYKWRKFAEIAVLIFCNKSDNTQGFRLVLSKGWIQPIIFEKSSISDVWLGSECVSDYPGVFSVSNSWDCWLES